MTLQETEQGRMNLWDKAFHAALVVGKDINEAIVWAQTAVSAFEAKFHPVEIEVNKEVVHVMDPNAS